MPTDSGPVLFAQDLPQSSAAELVNVSMGTQAEDAGAARGLLDHIVSLAISTKTSRGVCTNWIYRIRFLVLVGYTRVSNADPSNSPMVKPGPWNREP